MGLEFRNLDETIRGLMLEEIALDVKNGSLYISSYFNDRGVELWETLLTQAAAAGSDDTLAAAITANQCLKYQTTRNTKKGVILVDVPFNAAETIAESNFSRFYIRALCVHAGNTGCSHLVGYRAKYVETPRAGSEEKIGAQFHAAETLADVRATMSTAPAGGMPPGPNSGILAFLP